MAKPSVIYKDFRGNDVRIRENGTREVSISFIGDPGKTEQSHAPLCSIEYILNQYVGSNEPLALTEQQFMDYTALPDYHDCLNITREVEFLFNKLDAPIREQYKHDPGLFMAALEDPTQRDQLIALGVLKSPVKGVIGDTPTDGGIPPEKKTETPKGV
jgi:hypothetical protein